MINELWIKMKEEDHSVELGKMMSLPGLTYQGKVFCFQMKDQMVFKLGKDYDLEQHQVNTFEYLNPFKKKGPMKAWYVIDREYFNQYERLAIIALHKIRSAHERE